MMSLKWKTATGVFLAVLLMALLASSADAGGALPCHKQISPGMMGLHSCTIVRPIRLVIEGTVTKASTLQWQMSCPYKKAYYERKRSVKGKFREWIGPVNQPDLARIMAHSARCTLSVTVTRKKKVAWRGKFTIHVWSRPPASAGTGNA